MVLGGVLEETERFMVRWHVEEDTNARIAARPRCRRLEENGAGGAVEEGTKHTAERVAMYLAGPWPR